LKQAGVGVHTLLGACGDGARNHAYSSCMTSAVHRCSIHSFWWGLARSALLWGRWNLGGQPLGAFMMEVPTTIKPQGASHD
ncbi:hypothetical protein, partial [Xylella fastidiosa]